ncbi:Imm21 family immunity protein [Actinomadura adrarensis]|uniref:Imm21 family immunity protein n=1 Tax=Actinomadura adrarensis TaxID=1819600 RepID=A0ABW3C9H4_9ACTN
MLTWVYGSGPLVVVPESELPHWNGCPHTDGPLEEWGDYGRACTVEGYVGLVDVGAHQGLVLGDLPASTTFLEEERLFLRWVGADSEEELVTEARQALRDGVQWDDDEDVLWDVPGPVVLIDATMPGSEPEPDNHLVVDIAPARCRVRAAYRDDNSYMILVQLQP